MGVEEERKTGGAGRSRRGDPHSTPNSLTCTSSCNHPWASPLRSPSKFPVATQINNLLIFPHQSRSLWTN